MQLGACPIFQAVARTNDAPITAWSFCDDNADCAEEKARNCIGGYRRAVIEHDEPVGDRLGRTKEQA